MQTTEITTPAIDQARAAWRAANEAATISPTPANTKAADAALQAVRDAIDAEKVEQTRKAKQRTETMKLLAEADAEAEACTGADASERLRLAVLELDGAIFGVVAEEARAHTLRARVNTLRAELGQPVYPVSVAFLDRAVLAACQALTERVRTATDTHRRWYHIWRHAIELLTTPGTPGR